MLKEEYKWISFYMEFADKLRKYADNREELIQIIKNVYSSLKMKLPTLEKKDSPVIDIDPFTIFGLFNKGIKSESRTAIVAEFAKNFSIKAEVPYKFEGIPVLNNLAATFYGFIGDRKDDDIENLWKVFIAALDYADNSTIENKEIFCKYYNITLKQYCVKWNLSIGLYWIRPYVYLNLDSRNKNYILDNDMLKNAVNYDFKIIPDAEKYIEICSELRQIIENSENNYHDFPMFSNYVYLFSDTSASDTKNTYLSEIIASLRDLGGIASQVQICKRIEERKRIPNIKTNTNWKGVVSNAITTHSKDSASYVEGNEHLFYSVDGLGKGVWGLVNNDDRIIEQTDIYTKEEFLSEVYLTEHEYIRLAELLKNKKNIILQGAPGVGKTFAAKRLAYSIMGEKDESRIEFIQFHQNYSYEDFIMGYRPECDSFELKEGVFYRFCKKAKSDPEKKYFFIIDEINRGNMSKIFGELLMLIEADKRENSGYSVTLAYRNEKFSVPNNIYIIGIMNTADRSLAMIDYALRRRFSFFDMKSGFDTYGFKAYCNELHSEIFVSLTEQIKLLNNEIEKDSSLGKGFYIGHSYFCNLNKDSCTYERIRSIVDYDILPMLYEYWFDNADKADSWKKKLYNAIGAEYDE